MHPPQRIRADCPRCENRGIIPLDDADRTLACPMCNRWCTLCVAGAPSPFRVMRPHPGSLVAGAQATPTGTVLFEGYACDFHKLGPYSFIAPAMIGRYALGDAYIATGWGRVFVELYGYGEAANWRDLEDEARTAIAHYKYAPYGDGCYPCPSDLAARATRWG